MIVDLLLDLVALLVDGLTAVLPQSDLPFVTQLLSTAGTVNGYMHSFNSFLPMADLLQFYRWVGTVFLPGYLLFVTFRWVWAHIPIIGAGA